MRARQKWWKSCTDEQKSRTELKNDVNGIKTERTRRKKWKDRNAGVGGAAERLAI